MKEQEGRRKERKKEGKGRRGNFLRLTLEVGTEGAAAFSKMQSQIRTLVLLLPLVSFAPVRTQDRKDSSPSFPFLPSFVYASFGLFLPLSPLPATHFLFFITRRKKRERVRSPKTCRSRLKTPSFPGPAASSNIHVQPNELRSTTNFHSFVHSLRHSYPHTHIL